MKSKNRNPDFRARICAGLACIASSSGLAVEGPDVETYCEVHAAAMVAEMQAQTETPLKPDERALVRRTALQSCLAQRAPGQPAPSQPTASAQPRQRAEASAAAERPGQKPAAQASAETVKRPSDESFLDALGALFKGPTERSEGHDRLRRRGRY